MKNLKYNRRNFVKNIIGAGTLSTIFTGGAFLSTENFSDNHSNKDIQVKKYNDYSLDKNTLNKDFIIANGNDINKLVKTVFNAFGGIEKFINKNDNVLIKPNVGFDRPPSLAATSNPLLVGAIVKSCFDAGAKSVIVTDNSLNSPSASFTRSGIKEAVEKNGGNVYYPQDNDFEDINVDGNIIKNWNVLYKPFENIDKVIGIPIVKDHNLSKMSCSLKNWYGLLGKERNTLHQNIHHAISDLGIMIKPTLIIADAIRILMHNGPTGGSINDTKKQNMIIASYDQVAIDSFCTKLLEKDISEIKYINYAQDKGLGTSNWKDLKYEEISI